MSQLETAKQEAEQKLAHCVIQKSWPPSCSVSEAGTFQGLAEERSFSDLDIQSAWRVSALHRHSTFWWTLKEESNSEMAYVASDVTKWLWPYNIAIHLVRHIFSFHERPWLFNMASEVTIVASTPR